MAMYDIDHTLPVVSTFTSINVIHVLLDDHTLSVVATFTWENAIHVLLDEILVELLKHAI